ncbi:cold shock domain-containing protein [Seonamhaeicola sediminis]|uniref:Cold shock domain-containing protein n=1 Tax=Seonamhaeicola sediminis TaxID=2528206 RepID=A0A562YEP8_9FLAO|nr:cold shock domain-containing protein [Seonamhaeicola sediminis]TWO32999.1 cold shock domain-containing protein [Seonamhaeicola sediminis]
MGRSQQTFGKSEREKKRLKKREEKKKKMEARKLDAKENGKKGIEFAYVGYDGQLTDTPPDPSKKIKVKAKTIELGIPKKTEETEVFNPVRKGTVSFFDHSKGFGFIIDSETQEKFFTHVSGLIDEISEANKVLFELEKGQKGMNAVRVKLL